MQGGGLPFCLKVLNTWTICCHDLYLRKMSYFFYSKLTFILRWPLLSSLQLRALGSTTNPKEMHVTLKQLLYTEVISFPDPWYGTESMVWCIWYNIFEHYGTWRQQSDWFNELSCMYWASWPQVLAHLHRPPFHTSSLGWNPPSNFKGLALYQYQC